MGMVGKYPLDGPGFSDVTGNGGRTVRVDVVNLLRLKTGIPQSLLHAGRCTFAIFRGLRHVPGIAAQAVTDQLGINFRPPRPGVFQFLQYHYARAVTQDEAGSVLVPGPTGPGGIVVVFRQGACRGKAAQ